jgi:hypothetical protein
LETAQLYTVYVCIYVYETIPQYFERLEIFSRPDITIIRRYASIGHTAVPTRGPCSEAIKGKGRKLELWLVGDEE